MSGAQFLFAPWIAILSLSLAHAQSQSQQPYIDLLREGLEPEERPVPKPRAGEPDPYVQDLVRKQKIDDAERAKDESIPVRANDVKENYIETLKQTDPDLKKTDPPGSYSENEQKRLGPAQNGGAIKAVQDGRSQLHPNRSGPVRYTAGFKVGAAAKQDISVIRDAGTGRAFTDIYGNGWTPEMILFGEYQMIQMGGFAHISLTASGGGSYSSGSGKFAITLYNRAGSGAFSSNSQTKFKFFKVPLGVGAKFTISAWKYVQPYVQTGPTIIGYVENRDDGKADTRGNSGTFVSGGGVNILLDFLTPKTTWDLFHDYSVKHYYLTLDYTKISTFSGSVQFANSSFNVGLSYEF